MVKRLIPSAALALALAAAPSAGSGQLSASLSFHMGLFDGVGMGLAVSHLNPHSIYSPGFRVGFGASFGFGVGFGVSSYDRYGHGYYNDDYYYDDYYDDYYFDDYYHDRYYRPYSRSYYSGYSPFYCTWWGHPNPCWDYWGPYGYTGFRFSLGMAWNYYRRPVYFDPWWGSVGYYARWRPAWVYDPGWYYYNDPYWATPGYSRVAYVAPARGYIYSTAPHSGYRGTSYKENPRRVATSNPTARPRGSSSGVADRQPASTRPGRVAQPGTESPGVRRSGRPGVTSG
ncbi:MAG: hypothetical protein HKO65_07345, partial [Gemmatimonadetes bacterium]|nr:hypothetical protein [Gemmatimonadota bacterium]NNM04903.1 hypothetical protein [Gemmatimonadota bacterium]